PLTGIVAQGGLEMKYGIEMAAEEKGKVLGRPIELLVEDTQLKPPVGVTKAEKLVYKDGCIALIGVFSSGVGLAIAENIDKLKVPFLTTHVMTTEFYNLNPLVFRSGQLANDQTAIGNVQGILSNPELKNRTYYVIVHDYAWGHDAGDRFIALAKQKGIKIYNEAYDKAPTSTKDWSSYISKIKASGADGVYMAFITNVIPIFAKQASDFGLQAKGMKLVSAAAPGPLELEAGGEACYGIYGASDWSWDVNTPISDKWEKAFFDKYKTIPSDAAVHSYVGAMNLFNAIDKAGSTDAKAISAALKGISFNGPYGTVRIAKDNCARNDAVWTETVAAPKNPYGAKVSMKVLKTFKAAELGPPE
ncbi:MAG: ABC transporter substrate-binding protein, partial [Desulfobacterales bacterium]|nr:ABC transporter substrate-binding protein [Desulfobacterales bacterium]